MRIETAGRTQVGEINNVASYLSSNDIRLHFGLGGAKDDARGSKSLWPSGAKQVLTDVAVNQILTIEGTMTRGTPLAWHSSSSTCSATSARAARWPQKVASASCPAINRYLADAESAGMPVYATRDWHPEVTSHFKAHGGEWPPHCVQGTPGAEFHPASGPAVRCDRDQQGRSIPHRPGYSAFDGRTPAGEPFLADLRARGIDTLYVAGIATDYCVKQTVLDARRAGLGVTVLTDAITGIDANARRRRSGCGCHEGGRRGVRGPFGYSWRGPTGEKRSGIRTARLSASLRGRSPRHTTSAPAPSCPGA